MKSLSTFMALLFVSPLQQRAASEEVRFTRPHSVASTEATYVLFKEQFNQDWKLIFGLNSKDELSGLPLDPLPLYRLGRRCHGQVLLILPFERLIYQAHDKEITRGTTWITKNGTPVIIYGMDLEKQKFNLLFNGTLIDFHGSIDSQKECPDLLVTAKNPNFHGRTSGIGYSRLFFDASKNIFRLQAEEIQVSSIKE